MRWQALVTVMAALCPRRAVWSRVNRARRHPYNPASTLDPAHVFRGCSYRPRAFVVSLVLTLVSVADLYCLPRTRRAKPLTGGGWTGVADFSARNEFPFVLILGFFLLHPLDDHRRIKVAVRQYRRELIWPSDRTSVGSLQLRSVRAARPSSSPSSLSDDR